MQTMYIVPKSTNESRVHFSPEPARGHWPQPEKITHGAHPFFIQCWTPHRMGTAPFTLAQSPMWVPHVVQYNSEHITYAQQLKGNRLILAQRAKHKITKNNKHKKQISNNNDNNHFAAICPGLPGWASTRRNTHPLTILISSTIGPVSYIRISLCYFYFRWVTSFDVSSI